MAQSSKASSSTEGFFQPFPVLEPQYTSAHFMQCPPSISSQQISDDPVLARILRLYLPPEAQNEVGASLHKLSRRVLEPSVLQHSVEAERNVPTLHPFTTFGEVNKKDPLRTCEGWKALKAIGIEEGTVSTGYDKTKTNYNRRVAQFAINHVWSHTSAMTMCPMSMTDGAATLLSRHLDDPDDESWRGRQYFFNDVYHHLVSRDPAEAWTSGQWMTERTGGSDVSGTETVARRLSNDEIVMEMNTGLDQDSSGMGLGPWSIDGFKWFSSATDSDVVVLLARTTRGISAFLVPVRRKIQWLHERGVDPNVGYPTELNGIRIQRLKDKLGTKGLPTAELEIKGARGWLIGQEGKGIKEISSILNITRIYAAIGSVSYWSRGLAVCRAFTKVRKARGKFLYDHPQHVRWMADETVKYWAATQLTFFAVALLGCTTQGWEATAKNTLSATLIPQDPVHQEALLRLLTPVIKARVPVASVAGLRETMECLGGVGYCENDEDGGTMNLAKLLRDCIANTIWEGTASVMVEDVCRVIKDKRIAGGNVIEAVFCRWARTIVQYCRGRFARECELVEENIQSLVSLVQGASVQDMEYRGRHILSHLESISSAVLLLYDACTDRDVTITYIASRYFQPQAAGSSLHQREHPDRFEDRLIDSRIFLGDNFSQTRPEGKL
ncbi:acyl-CoA dehydrogenase/oxidase [Annulohypoxylon moriforme]|nr:acyl-CoA dehydrogenase/oxidase [Annulohypoxylon moriforme]